MDPKAEAAWEAYLEQQKWIYGMPGLKARPCFGAGYQAGRRAGALEMRERAAQENDCGCECRQEVLTVLKTSGRRKAKYACTQTAGECLALNAADIRTLPLEDQ